MSFQKNRYGDGQRNFQKRASKVLVPKFQDLVLNCQVLSPLHVGNGEEIPVYEYIIQNGLLFKISVQRAIKFLNKNELEEFNSLNKDGNYVGLRHFLIQKYSDDAFRSKVTEFVVPVSSEVEEEYLEKLDSIENQLIIHLNQRNLLKKTPIIPGSSIKGAIRTAVLNSLSRLYDMPLDVKKTVLLEAHLLNALTRNKKWIDAGKDPFKYLKTKDVELRLHDMEISKILNAINSEDGFFSIDIQMNFETIRSLLTGAEVKFQLPLKIAPRSIFLNGQKIDFDADYIVNACQDYYRTRLERIEASYFRNSPILNEINRIDNAVDFSKGEFLLRVGRFSGKMSLTLDKYRTGAEPKSRNLVSGKYPMGWIKCSRA